MTLIAQTFDQLINFTRTSAGTFVGSNGLIQTTPASVNLLTYTQEFDNAAWTKTNATITANSTTAPDGTATADKVEAAASAANVSQDVVVNASAVTLSAYFKKGNSATSVNSLLIRSQTLGTNLLAARVNLDTGDITYLTGSTGASVENVGNGWWRLILSTSVTPGNTIRAGVLGGFSASAGDFSFIWGAQLEVGSTATTYTRNFGGRFPPRFDYDPITLLPRGLLVEEQRTNRTLQSENFTISPWEAAVTGTSTRANAGSPLGFVRGLVIATSAQGGIRQVHSGLSSGQVYALSFYIQSTATSVAISFENGAAGFGAVHSVTINPSNGTAGALTGFTGVSIQPFGSGYVYALTTAPAGGTLVANIEWRITNSGDSIFLGRPQFEAGAFATSYIPTVASQVTRTADVVAIAAPNFSPFYNQTEGTFVANVSYLNAVNTAWALAAHGGTAASTTNYIAMVKNSAAINRQSIVVGGVNQGNLDFSGAVANTVYKLAGAYRANDAAFTVNAAAPLTDTSVALPTAAELQVGNLFTQYFNGHIRSIDYYPVRLTNATLQALTA